MVIDCDACAARGPACGDCVVSVLLGGPPVQGEHPHPAAAGSGVTPVELDGAERAALAVLAGCGLVPPLRLVPLDPAGEGRPGAPGEEPPGPSASSGPSASAGRSDDVSSGRTGRYPVGRAAQREVS